jgi:D-alanine-D-alanine ligase
MSGEMTKKTRVALVFGGRSDEHDVSIVSARSVDRALDRSRFEVVPMAIDRGGLWADAETSRRVLAESSDRADDVVRFKGRHRLDRRLIDDALDVAFPVLHGPFGEDGTIQGLFDMLDLPYVGCDTASSALCMDKVFCKRLLSQAGLPTVEWVELDRESWGEKPGGLIEASLAIGLPLFVKPARLGSSVGITKVVEDTALVHAIELALDHGDRALVEKGLDAREIEVAVLGNSHPRAAVPGEVVPGNEFYDYEDKYLESTSELLAPAPLEEPMIAHVQATAIEAFRILGCSGMARVDLFLEREPETLWVNEVNTIPGFTSISLYPRLWGLSGLEYPALIEELIRLALERSAER